MSTEENKRVVEEFFARFSGGDVAGALGLLAEGATWWIAGRRESQPAAGEHGKEEVARILGNMGARLKDGLRMEVRGMVAEGDRVAAEVESRGELENGRVYNNQYHFLLTVRGGRITAVREYLDTQHVFDTWFKP